MRYSDTMTFEAILAELLSHVPDTVDKREGSIIYNALAPIAAELSKAYIELDVIMDETFVDTASFYYLAKRCDERGVPIKWETAATVQGTFTPSTLELANGLRFNCNDQNYFITEKVSAGVYKLNAETAGTGGNLHAGFLLPIQGIEGLETAQITGLLIPGEDGDTTETLRDRYYESLESMAFGGNQADYRERVGLLDGVGGVKVHPVWNGAGTVKLAIINATFAVPSAELIQTVQTAVDPTQNQGMGVGFAPIGHVVTVVGVSTTTINVASKITFASGWSWESAKSVIKKAVTDYFLELAKSWAKEAYTIVRISQIENRILNLPCTLDIADTTINGQTKNIQLEADNIPVLGEMAVIA